VGAGTTVTRDVPAGALALARAPQIEKGGYADEVASRYAGGKPAKSTGPAKPAEGNARAKASKVVTEVSRKTRKLANKTGKSAR